MSAPNDVEVTRTSSGKYAQKAMKLLCKTCYSLQNYRTSADHKNFRLQCSASHTVDDIITRIPPDAVVISVVDVLNLESSIVPELHEALSRRRNRVVTVLNKMDCLPVATKDWTSIRSWSLKVSKVLRGLVGADGKSDVVPISSDSEAGFNDLENRLGSYLSASRENKIFVVGSINSGKSTFLTRFARFIGYKHLGCVHYKRRVGGLTRSAVPGSTLDFIPLRVSKDLILYDTPGVPGSGRMEEHLSTSRDLYSLSSGKSLQPITYAVREGKSLLIGGMCRIEVNAGSSALLTTFVSPDITLHICNSDRAEDLLNRKAGTFLYPPHSPPEEQTPDIMKKRWKKHRVRVRAGPSISHDDISIAGLGWISVNGQGSKTLDVWVPEGVRVFRRPAMLPKYIQRHGSSRFSFRRHARSLKVNKLKKRIIQDRRDSNERERWRMATHEAQECYKFPTASVPTGSSLVEDAVAQEYNISGHA